MSKPNILRSQQIRGWMVRRDLKYLACLAEKAETIIEVGIYKGRTTTCLCENTQGRVFSIDKFDDFDVPQSNAQKQIRKNPDIFFKELKDNLTPYITQGKLIPLQIDSLDAAKTLRFIIDCIGGADLIFLDSDHQEKHVTKEIKAWMPLLHPDGVLAGHDVQWDTVRQALQKEAPGWTIPPYTANLWEWRPGFISSNELRESH